MRNVALICTTYNCKDELDACLEAFTSRRNLELLREIVIVDGGSKDGTWELLNKWAQSVDKLKVYRAVGANIPRGRNEAIKKTKADIIVTFDSGTRYGENWLELMLKPFADEKVQVVGGLTVSCGETLFSSCAAAFEDRQRLAADPSHRGCAFYKGVWEKIGGYPEHVRAGEDTWFNAQWRKLGLKYVHVPQAEQYWQVRKTWPAAFKMARRNTKGHVALGRSSGDVTIALITAVCLSCVTCLIAGFYNHLIWYIAAAIYASNVGKRMFSKNRWRVFVNPVKFLVGLYALTALDLGVAVGAIEGFILFLRHKITDRKAHGYE